MYQRLRIGLKAADIRKISGHSPKPATEEEKCKTNYYVKIRRFNDQGTDGPGQNTLVIDGPYKGETTGHDTDSG